MEGRTDGASLKERELAIALRNLQRTGWTFQLVPRASEGFLQPDASFSTERDVDGAGAYRFLLDERRDPDPIEGDRMRLVNARGTVHELSAPDEVASLDFFYGSGDPGSLKNPALARALMAVGARGLGVESDDPRLGGAWGAYVALMRGERALLTIEGVVFAEFGGTTPTLLDAAAAPLDDLLAVAKELVEGEVASGTLPRNRVGHVLRAVRDEVAGVRLRDRVGAWQRLAYAVRGTVTPESPISPTDLLLQSVAAYEAIVELDLDAASFYDALDTMEALLRTVGTDSARDALHALHHELARVTPFIEVRREHTLVFRRLLARGLDPRAAAAVAPRVVMRSWDEPLEPRIDLFERLLKAARVQPGYDVRSDFEALLRYAGFDVPLAQSARSFLSLFEALADRGQAQEASPTLGFLHEGLRLGRFANNGGDVIEALIARYVSLLETAIDAHEARLRLLHGAGT